jgi:transcriptional regulator with XRE-family HTH domain
MARAALQLGVRELAALAQVSTGTVTKLERGEALLPRSAEAVQRALEAQGVESSTIRQVRGFETPKVSASAEARSRNGDCERSLPPSTRTPERHKARDRAIQAGAGMQNFIALQAKAHTEGRRRVVAKLAGGPCDPSATLLLGSHAGRAIRLVSWPTRSGRAEGTVDVLRSHRQPLYALTCNATLLATVQVAEKLPTIHCNER